jgi:hypothetical protein
MFSALCTPARLDQSSRRERASRAILFGFAAPESGLDTAPETIIRLGGEDQMAAGYSGKQKHRLRRRRYIRRRSLRRIRKTKK